MVLVYGSRSNLAPFFQMKLFTVIFFILFISCTKQQIEQPPGKAVTQFRSRCDKNWNVLETYVVIHWCSVIGDDLKRFEQKVGIKDSTNCPVNAISWYEISESDCNKTN